jgi:hypothetical protein
MRFAKETLPKPVWAIVAAMRFSPRFLRRHGFIAVAAMLAGLYGWVMLATTASGHDGAVGPRFNAPGADWVIFLAAARAFFTGDLSHIYNQVWITQAVNSGFAHWLSVPEPFPLFPYPPVFLLLVLPFAALPVGLSLAASQLLSFGGLALAVRRLAPDRATYVVLVGALVLCPAASNNVLAGQNGFLALALICGGVLCLKDRPLLAGALLGLMIFKPQYFLLLPIALAAAGERRALVGMAASALLFVAASVLLFGPGLWWDWIAVYLHPQHTMAVNATEWGHMWDESVSTCAALLGAPGWLAKAAQGLAILVAAGAVWRAFRWDLPVEAQLGVLLAAALLASPHVSPYDLIFAALGGLILAARLGEGMRPLALLLPQMAWLAPLYSPPRVNPVGFLAPLVLVGLIWMFLSPWGGERRPVAPTGAQRSRRGRRP